VVFEQDEILKIIFSLVAGGLVGFEREFHDKPAGLRTLMFICFGSTVFTILSVKLADGRDPTRIAANIISGIGFLGAGVILRDRGRVVGLTTAATIWFTAALGMVIGGGYYVLAVKILIAALVVLWFFPIIERWISIVREERNYEIVCTLSSEREPQLRTEFQRFGLQVSSFQQRKLGDSLHFYWRVSGSRSNHEKLIQHLISNPAIKEFNV
jgi:putative Mg2+ transporter-C (MgtC) family protein